MSSIDRKAINREYKNTPRPAGVFRVRNSAARKSLVGSTTDLPSMLNRQRFQLENGLHPDRELQKDWIELGANGFEFEILDRLEPSDEPTYDPTEDLAALKQMWIEELTKSGEALYHQSKRGT
jgi:hypothetical protein